VFYDEKLIGTLIPDLIVNDTVIVDTKVVTSFNDTHIAQMLGYLNITGLKLHSCLISNTPSFKSNASPPNQSSSSSCSSFLPGEFVCLKPEHSKTPVTFRRPVA
jgi:hypothetical protein